MVSSRIREALTIAREITSPKAEADALEELGLADRARGDDDAATAHLRQALEICQRRGAAPGIRRIQALLDEQPDPMES